MVAHLLATPHRLHPDRIARRHRDHRRPDRPVAARRAGRPRSRPPRPVHQQPQAARPGRHELRVGQRHASPAACSVAATTYKGSTYYRDNFSGFARMLPFTEQAPMYNSVNFNLTYANIENLTICGVQINTLDLPERHQHRTPRRSTTANGFTASNYDDPERHDHRHWRTSPRYSSSQGTFWSNYYIGASGGTQVQTQHNGAIYHRRHRQDRQRSPTGPATRSSSARRPTATSRSTTRSIRTATPPGPVGLYFDTMFTTTYPPNLPTSNTPGLSLTGTPATVTITPRTPPATTRAGSISPSATARSDSSRTRSVLDVRDRGSGQLRRCDPRRHDLQRQHASSGGSNATTPYRSSASIKRSPPAPAARWSAPTRTDGRGRRVGRDRAIRRAETSTRPARVHPFRLGADRSDRLRDLRILRPAERHAHVSSLLSRHPAAALDRLRRRPPPWNPPCPRPASITAASWSRLTDKQAYVELLNGKRAMNRQDRRRRPSWPICSKPTARPRSPRRPTSVEVKIGTPRRRASGRPQAGAGFDRSPGELSLRFQTGPLERQPGRLAT